MHATSDSAWSVSSDAAHALRVENCNLPTSGHLDWTPKQQKREWRHGPVPCLAASFLLGAANVHYLPARPAPLTSAPWVFMHHPFSETALPRWYLALANPALGPCSRQATL